MKDMLKKLTQEMLFLLGIGDNKKDLLREGDGVRD